MDEENKVPEQCECGMSLSEDTRCSCEPSKCYYCCSCAEGCGCGCDKKRDSDDKSADDSE